MREFEQDHLKAFKASQPLKLNRNERGGKTARKFAVGFLAADPKALEDSTVSHDEVVGHVRSKANIDTVCAAILAWGGMHYASRSSLINQGNTDWLSVCEDIRKGKLSRTKAFGLLKKLRDDGKLTGLGCAFFTKLIYFLQFSGVAQKPGGYIMDQWASETVNLLTGDVVVKLDTTFKWKWTIINGVPKAPIVNSVVSDLNDVENYRSFCDYMDKLAIEAVDPGQAPLTRAQLDRGVMSAPKGEENSWRSHIETNRVGRISLGN